MTDLRSLVLKKTESFNEWALVNLEGRVIHTFNATSKEEARMRAKVWASSWSTVHIVEKTDE